MKRSQKRKSAWRAGPAPAGPADEWVGGHVSLPVYVQGDSPVRPDLVMWVAGGAPVAATSILPGASEDDLAGTLLELLDRPVVPVARPRRIRVGSAAVAGRLREALGGAVTVAVGPTPEVAAAAEAFVAALPRLDEIAPQSDLRGPSYLEHGRIPPEEVAAFFESAGRLFRTAPWEVVLLDSELLGLDIPSLGIEGSCVSIVGQSGLSRGAAIHASFDAYRRFRALAGQDRGSPIAVGAPLLAIDFAARDDLPELMAREADEHGFPLPEPGVYPATLLVDGEGVPVPLTVADVRKARAAAEALARFFEQHRRLDFRRGPVLTERFQLESLPGKPTAVVTAPFLHQGPAKQAKAPAKQAKAPPGQARGEPRPATREAIRRVVTQVWLPRFQERHSDEIERAATDIYDVLAATAGVDMERTFRELGSLPEVWAACWRPMTGGATGLSEARSVRALQAPAAQAAIERLVRARGTVAEIVHLDAASARAWLRDLFDGTTYVLLVHENMAAKGTRHLRMFGVLVELGDGTWDFPSVLVGSDGFQAMSPGAILDAARDAVSEVGADPDEIDRAAPHAGLTRWAGVVGAKLLSLRAPVRRKRLVTSEGHAPETNTAHLVLPPEAERALWAARADDIVHAAETLAFVDRSLRRIYPDGETIGVVARAGGELRLETLARERCERVLDRIQQITGERPRVESLRRNPAPGGGSTPEPGEDVDEVVIGAAVPVAAGQPSPVGRAAQLRHLRAMLDAHVPLIGGVPRALAATEEGRAAVERWLRDAERSGFAGGEGPRFLDLDPLRAELGLPTIASGLGS